MDFDDMTVYQRAECVVFKKTHEAFGGLSNMAAGYPLNVNSIAIRTSEAIYQACRYPKLPEVQKLIIAECSPMAAKMRAKPHRAESRDDWDDVRLRIMEWCLRVKLAQHWQKFGDLLRATGEQEIVEESTRDQLWGAKTQADGTLVGYNALGRRLVILRNKLRDSAPESLTHVEPLEIPDFLLYGEQITAVDGE